MTPLSKENFSGCRSRSSLKGISLLKLLFLQPQTDIGRTFFFVFDVFTKKDMLTKGCAFFHRHLIEDSY